MSKNSRVFFFIALVSLFMISIKADYDLDDEGEIDYSNQISQNNESDKLNEENNLCEIDMQTEQLNFNDNSNQAGKKAIYVYVGSNFNYKVGCTVKDTNFKPGDKYYTIDLIVYGPNTRVAKAWQDQLEIKSDLDHFSTNKILSFRWIGINSIVCSVSKYNQNMNKITRICQQSIKVNATENTSERDNSVLRLKENLISEFQKMRLRQLWFNDYTTTNKPTTTRENKLAEIIYDDDDSNEAFIDEKLILDKQNLDKQSVILNSLIRGNKNLTAFKLDESPNNFDAKLISSNLNESKVTRLIHKWKFMEPLTVVLIFIFIFSISIGTIVYLTYFQHTNIMDQYNFVQSEPVPLANESITTPTEKSIRKQWNDFFLAKNLKKLKLFGHGKNTEIPCSSSSVDASENVYDSPATSPKSDKSAEWNHSNSN
jgi:hypothetical protein